MKTTTPGNHTPKAKFSVWHLIIKHSTVSVLLLSILALTVVYIWKETQFEKQKTAMLKTANQQIEKNQQDLLKILVKPLVWDIRSEMLRGNMEQINFLISDLVKEKNFRFIHLVASDGKVILSTNKSLEGKQIDDTIIAHLLLVESASIVELADKSIVVAAPVMGVDRRLATLVLGYKTVKIE